jgi:hypothetical protein
MLTKNRLKFWSIITVTIFAVLALWCFGLHESLHILACDASGLQGSLLDYRTGNCAGLDTAPSWTFFFVKSAPYMVDAVAGLFLWLLVRRIDVVGLLRKGSTAKKRAGSSGGSTPSPRSAEGNLKGIVLFTALNSLLVAILFDVASNYFGMVLGFTDFLSIIAYDPGLFLPAVAVSFVGMLLSLLAFREEAVRIRPHMKQNRERWLFKINR